MDAYEFFVLKLEDLEEVVQFLENEFFQKEPLSMGLRIKNMQASKGRTGSDIRNCIESGMSIGVRHRPTGELAGVRMSKVTKSTDSKTPEVQAIGEQKAVYHLLDIFTSAVDAFEGTSKVLAMYMLSVHRNHGGRGLGRKLVEICMERGVAEGCERAISIITNRLSGKIFLKLGYDSGYVLDLSNREKEFQLDTSLMNGNTTMTFMSKSLP